MRTKCDRCDAVVAHQLKLEEANDKLRRQVSIYEKALEMICDNRCAIGLNPCEARAALEEGRK